MRKIVTFLVAAGVLGLVGCTQPKATSTTRPYRAPDPTPTFSDLTPHGTPTASPTAPPRIDTAPAKPADTTPPKKPTTEGITPVDPPKKPG